MVNVYDEIVDSNEGQLFLEKNKEACWTFWLSSVAIQQSGGAYQDVFLDRLKPIIKVFMAPECTIITDG